MWDTAAKPGRTGQVAIVRNMQKEEKNQNKQTNKQKTNGSDMFLIVCGVAFCQLCYILRNCYENIIYIYMLCNLKQVVAVWVN